MREITYALFEQEAPKKRRPWVVLFYAHACPAAHYLQESLEALEPAYCDRLEFARVDIATAGPGALRYGVYSTPNLLVLRKGAVVYQLMGTLPQRELNLVLDTAAHAYAECVS